MSVTDSTGRAVGDSVGADSPAFPTYTSKFPELGFYALPGHTRSPRAALQQARDAEELGVGNVMLSERMDFKEASAVCGGIAAVTSEIFIGTSATNLNTRHPMVTAAMCSTLHRLSEGRFALGLAKGGGKERWRMWGLAANTYRREEEFLTLMRRLWSGETVSYDGPLGTYPMLKQADYLNEDIPILYVGFGPKSVRHAGAHFDGVHLHTFMSDEALANSVAQVRAGETSAGRSPRQVKVWSVLATLCQPSDERYLKAITARLATYLQFPGYGDVLVEINGWDPEVLMAFRRHPDVQAVGGWIDSVATAAQLEKIDRLIPQEWRPAALGSAADCARRWSDQFNAGADGIIVHASTPEEFAPVLAEYEKIRRAERFASRTNRPA